MSSSATRHYNFSVSKDYFYRVGDVTPAELNREHKHRDVEIGLDTYTVNYPALLCYSLTSLVALLLEDGVLPIKLDKLGGLLLTQTNADEDQINCT